ncbi:MAG: ferritin family protein [Phycisphaerae bacterium]|nr:ferritin family protein [Phycisphaerae bacterium]
MAEQFEVTELVKIAVEDEISGVAFYTALAGKAKDAELRKVFADLAEQEKYHQKRFEAMLAELGGHHAPEQYPGEYVAYLQVLTSSRAFPDPQAARKAAEQCRDDAAALGLATRFERDTLMLMNEMRQLMPARDAAIVEEVASEEQAHLVTLTEARQRLGV